MTSVSVVIPAYNQAQYLAQAIDSVLSQSHSQVELIVLDDGSTDDTRNVLERYESRLRWEFHPNMGQAATLNRGWGMCGGEILGYLSADDELHPEAAARAVALLDARQELVACYCDFTLFDEHSRPWRAVRTPDFNYAEMVIDAVCPPGPGAFFRRSAFERCGGWNPALRRIPDFEFWLRLGLLGPFQRIPEVLARYRVHSGAQSFSPVSSERAEEIVSVIGALLEHPELPGALRSRGAAARATALLYAARLHLSGRIRFGLARAAAAMAVDPRAALRLRTYRLLASGLLWRARLASQ